MTNASERCGGEESPDETVRVTVEYEFQVPGDICEPEHREDYFWNYWREFLANEPTRKNNITDVEAVDP